MQMSPYLVIIHPLMLLHTVTDNKKITVLEKLKLYEGCPCVEQNVGQRDLEKQ